MTDQYRVHGLHLHPATSPTSITKGPDGKLTLTAESKDQGKVRARPPLGDHATSALLPVQCSTDFHGILWPPTVG